MTATAQLDAVLAQAETGLEQSLERLYALLRRPMPASASRRRTGLPAS
jgi:hypothetical protein